MWQSIGLTLLVIVATLACVLLFMLCGECPSLALRVRVCVSVPWSGPSLLPPLRRCQAKGVGREEHGAPLCVSRSQRPLLLFSHI